MIIWAINANFRIILIILMHSYIFNKVRFIWRKIIFHVMMRMRWRMSSIAHKVAHNMDSWNWMLEIMLNTHAHVKPNNSSTLSWHSRARCLLYSTQQAHTHALCTCKNAVLTSAGTHTHNSFLSKRTHTHLHACWVTWVKFNRFSSWACQISPVTKA